MSQHSYFEFIEGQSKIKQNEKKLVKSDEPPIKVIIDPLIKFCKDGCLIKRETHV